jgi:ABC-type transport system involved in multi-copper enzyme maturation permease subunit
MNEALAAEAMKLSRHRATWFLVWLYPIAFLVVMLLGIAFDLAQANKPDAAQALGSWLEETAIIWEVPASGFGRYLIAAYVAVAIAGEYSWNTWKLIVPHRSRAVLLGAKLVTVTGFLYLAFLAAALITIVLMWTWDVATGDPLPAGLSLRELVAVNGLAALNTLPPFLYTLAFASLAAILTRSMIATLVISLFVTSESMFPLIAPLLYPRAEALVTALVHVLPGFHLHNLESWITTGQARPLPLAMDHIVTLSWPTSAAILAAWTAGLAVLAFVSFRRQDIN